MKKLLSVTLCIFAACALLHAGGEKVVDSVGRTPKWIYSAEKEYIIVSAESADIEEAKEKAMTKVKKQIMSSIAENVRSSSKISTSEVNANGKFDIIEQYESAIETESAPVPFLSEVGISKAEASYWEKIKKDKDTYYYRYHLKYPFTKFDLIRMSDAFLEREQQLDKQLAAFAQDDFTSYSSTEEMIQQLQQLKVFKSSLMQNDARRVACQNIEKAYTGYIKSITMRLISVNRNQLVYAPYYGEKRLTTNLQPKLASNCLGDLQYIARNGQCIVTYDFQTACYPDEENYLEVTLNLLGNKIKNRFIVK